MDKDILFAKWFAGSQFEDDNPNKPVVMAETEYGSSTVVLCDSDILAEHIAEIHNKFLFMALDGLASYDY